MTTVPAPTLLKAALADGPETVVFGSRVDADEIAAAVRYFKVGDSWEIVCRPNGRGWALWLDWCVDSEGLIELLELAAAGGGECVDYTPSTWSSDEVDGPRWIPLDESDGEVVDAFYFVRYLLSVD